MTSGVQGEFYIGVVSSVGDDFKITVNIPSVGEDFDAFPVRGDHDEPKIGDKVLLLSLDPQNHSYFTYWKLKENSFLGFRAYGKEISISEEKLVIRSYSGDNKDDSDDNPGEDKCRIELDKSGNISIVVNGDADITVKNEARINTNIATVKGTDIEIGAGDEGFGTLKVNSAGVIPDANGGPFIAFPGQLITPTPGEPIPTGNTIILQ